MRKNESTIICNDDWEKYKIPPFYHVVPAIQKSFFLHFRINSIQKCDNKQEICIIDKDIIELVSSYVFPSIEKRISIIKERQKKRALIKTEGERDVCYAKDFVHYLLDVFIAIANRRMRL